MITHCPLCNTKLKYVIYGPGYTHYSYSDCYCKNYHTEISKQNDVYEWLDLDDTGEKFSYNRLYIDHTNNISIISTYEWFEINEIRISIIPSIRSKEDLEKFIKNAILLK
jgi:hypothetical protein